MTSRGGASAAAEQTVGVSRFRPGREAATLVAMPNYLVESYLARTRAADLDAATARADDAAEAMRREGIAVRHVRTTFLPGDEVCLHLFEAPSLEAASELTRRAEIAFHRIVQAVEIGVSAERSFG